MEENIRHDRFTFYVMAIMSFLESTAPTFVDNLNVIYKDDKELMQWLKNTWLPEEYEHGRLGKQFVEEIWPDFNWTVAYNAFMLSYESRCSYEVLRSSLSMEALCRCVTETEAAMFYRCISEYTSSEKLKKLMDKLSSDETRHYKVFKGVYKKYSTTENIGMLETVKTMLSRSELVKDEDLKLAFSVLNKHWRHKPPFEKYEFSGFLDDAKRIIISHFPVESAKKMLFKPIKKKGLLNKLLLFVVEILIKSHYLGFVAQLSLKKAKNSFRHKVGAT